jgi:hypothetical protein
MRQPHAASLNRDHSDARATGTVPALRRIAKDAAPRPGQDLNPE